MSTLSHSYPQPDDFARWIPRAGSYLLTLLFGGGLVVTAATAWFASELLPVIPLLFCTPLAFYLVLRHEHIALYTALLGFILILRFSDAIEPQEVLYYLYYVIYLGTWFVSRLFLRKEPIFRDLGDWLLLAYITYATSTFAFTIALGGSLSSGIREWLPLVFLLFYFPIKEACIRSPKVTVTILKLFLLLSLFATLLNFYEYVTDLQSATALWRILAERVRSNERLLMVSLIGLLVFFLQARDFRSRLTMFGGMLLFAAGVVISQSRAVWIAFILSVVVILFLLDSRKRIELLTLSIGSLVLAVVVGAIFLPGYFDLIVVALVNRASSLSTASSADISLLNRFVEWGAAWERILQTPVLGHGFGVQFHFFDLTRELTMVKSHIHSTFLGILYRHGLIGLCLYLVFYIRSIWIAARLSRLMPAPDYVRSVGMIAVGCLFALALSATMEDLLLADEGAMVIALPIAVASGIWQRHRLLSSMSTDTPPHAVQT